MKLKVLAASVALFFGISIAPQKADAMLVMEPDNAIFFFVPGSELVCLLLLPFCILDQKAEITHVTAQDLRDNGYSDAQISNIEAGQTEVANYMKDHQLKNASEMLQAVEAIKSSLNADYLGFVSANP